MSLVEQGKTQEHGPTPFRRDRFHAYLRTITNGHVGNATLWNILSEVAKDAVREGIPGGSTKRLESTAMYLTSLRMEMGDQFHLAPVVSRFLDDLKDVGLAQKKIDLVSLLLKVRSGENNLTHQRFVLDRTSGKVEKPNGEIVTLTPTELAIFIPLISLAGQSVPREVLEKPLAHLNSKSTGDSLRAYMRTYINYLRKKLDEKDSATGQWRWIKAVKGEGYVFGKQE